MKKLEEIIGRGQEKGQITSEYSPEMLAANFLLSFRGVTADWSRHDGGYPIVEKMDSYIEFFVRSLKP